ncbi:ImmA/IrrE family metallo-endopeptidase [Corynebacterium phocae]|uniref:ImmA/IrrE family metallo-endopeptidase n=1 Tax=Corynebacterium phocae TaxID=161895 RepID=UPI0009533D71|nr:ImmA/IrrE family metallo-endopeptidase [Corynebacterium phocae]KAA8725761.1 ImmA/IrrE family metallo-endopeptidase [Corynebacterium phocae]
MSPKIGARLREERVAQNLSSGDVSAQTKIPLDRLYLLEEDQVDFTNRDINRILRILKKPVAWLIEPELPVIARRYKSLDLKRNTEFDLALEYLAYDVRHLLDIDVLAGVERPHFDVTRTHRQAAVLASKIRSSSQTSPTAPILNISALCEELGLLVFAAEFPDTNNAGGSMLEILATKDDRTIGIALIDSSKHYFLQRFTLAHELCHWLIGDDFETAPEDKSTLVPRGNVSEKISDEAFCNSFAAHLLFPEEARRKVVQTSSMEKIGQSATKLALQYQISWHSTVDLLMSSGLIEKPTAELLREDPFLDSKVMDSQPPAAIEQVSLTFRAAVERAKSRGVLTPMQAEKYLYGFRPN